MKTQTCWVIATLATASFCLPQVHADTFDSQNYFEIYSATDQYQTPEVIQTQNEEVLVQLEASSKNEYPRRASQVTLSEAREIYSAVSNHPVASLYELPKYDPQGGIGFCFGRAMTVHLESLFRGVSKSAIRKIWALGDLSTGEMSWRYHVTTIVKGPGKTWYAIDPIMDQVMTVRAWYAAMKKYDTNGKMKLYITDASKFGPSGGKYNKGHLMNDFYNNYFEDLLKHYQEKAEQMRRDF